MSPKKVPFQNEFSRDIRELSWGIPASKRLKTPKTACPPKELPFLRRQPWWRCGKGFRHGGRSKRRGCDRWLLQRRDGKHLQKLRRKNTWIICHFLPHPPKKGRKTHVFGDFLRIFFGGVEIYGNTQVFCKGASMCETSLNNSTYVFLPYGCKNEYPTDEYSAIMCAYVTISSMRGKDVPRSVDFTDVPNHHQIHHEGNPFTKTPKVDHF